MSRRFETGAMTSSNSIRCQSRSGKPKKKMEKKEKRNKSSASFPPPRKRKKETKNGFIKKKKMALDRVLLDSSFKLFSIYWNDLADENGFVLHWLSGLRFSLKSFTWNRFCGCLAVFHWALPGLIRFSMGSTKKLTRVVWVLPGFTGFYRVFTVVDCFLLGITWF